LHTITLVARLEENAATRNGRGLQHFCQAVLKVLIAVVEQRHGLDQRKVKMVGNIRPGLDGKVSKEGVLDMRLAVGPVILDVACNFCLDVGRKSLVVEESLQKWCKKKEKKNCERRKAGS
jgi:hypothetical protein